MLLLGQWPSAHAVIMWDGRGERGRLSGHPIPTQGAYHYLLCAFTVTLS